MISLLTVLRFLPLPLLRALGAVLGWLLYALMPSRRHTVRTNLRLCFPKWTSAQREATVRQVFVYFMQSWLDRFWLWHSPKALLSQRLRIVFVGDAQAQNSSHPLFSSHPRVIFAPHFVGLDAGWTALNCLTDQPYATIYAKQKNPAVDAWIRTGRTRSSRNQAPLLIEHLSSVRPAVQAMRAGAALYLLPDMNYEPDDSFFLPFFGNTAATLPILPRYAKLGQAQVIPVVTRMTDWGYEVQIHPAWDNYPSNAHPNDPQTNLKNDTQRMNQALEEWICAMPAQYYWVHRRFKDQPRDATGRGGPNPYDDWAGYQQAQTQTQTQTSA